MHTPPPEGVHHSTQLPNLSALHLIVLRGRTGCGKSSILRALEELDQQVLDLEQLANHRGSAFGGLGMSQQPTAPDFLARLEARIAKLTTAKPLYLEFSGDYLGRLAIPLELNRQIEQAGWIRLLASDEQRIKRIVETYAGVGERSLLHAAKRLKGRLPNLILKPILKSIRRGEYYDAVRQLLPYYDKAYEHQMAQAAGLCLFTLEIDDRPSGEVASALLQRVEESTLVDPSSASVC